MITQLDQIPGFGKLVTQLVDAVFADTRKGPVYVGLLPGQREELEKQWHGRCAVTLERTFQRLLAKDPGLWESHAFHPDNKVFRKLFTAVTGIELPKTVKGTQEAVAVYIGEAVQQLIETERAETAAAIAAEEAERLSEIRAIESLIQRGLGISGQELLKVVRHHGLGIHPRTAGAFKESVYEVKAHSMRSSGRSFNCCDYYQAIQRILSRPLEPSDESSDDA